MKSWKSTLVSADTPLREALARIDTAATRIALVVDPKGRLLGTLSDGDIRRGLLAGTGLDDPVSKCMFSAPTTALVGESRQDIISKMRQLTLQQIPVVDDSGRVVDLKTLDEYLAPQPRDNWVVIMAGGLGTRLKELTSNTPKPMLPVGNRPLLETIVRRFVEQGFCNLWLAVNHHADKIESYFGDGRKFGADVRYLRESKRLGTGGALSLLPPPKMPLIVTNADLLSTVDYVEMMEAHVASDALATMGVREYEYQIPYGVVRTADDDIKIAEVQEKPVQHALVNAGIYVLSPAAVAQVPQDTLFDMPELFAALIKESKAVRCHRIKGYWLDIGQYEDYHKANGDFPEVFP